MPKGILGFLIGGAIASSFWSFALFKNPFLLIPGIVLSIVCAIAVAVWATNER